MRYEKKLRIVFDFLSKVFIRYEVLELFYHFEFIPTTENPNFVNYVEN